MAVNIAAITTINRARLYQGQPGTTVATVYTVPAATDVKITSIVLCNTTGTSANVTLSVVPSAGTAGAGNRIAAALVIDPNSVVTLDTPIHLTTGDFIAALQGTGSAVTVTISGETYA